MVTAAKYYLCEIPSPYWSSLALAISLILKPFYLCQRLCHFQTVRGCVWPLGLIIKFLRAYLRNARFSRRSPPRTEQRNQLCTAFVKHYRNHLGQGDEN